MLNSSAREPFLGYLYQAIYSLYILMQKGAHNPTLSIAIEKFDDITFEDNNDHLNLIQAKHKVNRKGSLSNTSTDLWKTIYNWIQYVEYSDGSYSDNIYSIISTSVSTINTASFYLRPDEQSRNVEKAIEELESARSSSVSTTLESAFLAFDNLSDDEKYELFNRVYIFDNEPLVSEIKEKVLVQFDFFVPPDFKEQIYDSLLGWWINVLIQSLKSNNIRSISYTRIRSKFQDILDDYSKESLPISYPVALTEDEVELSSDQKFFLSQLELISLGRARIVHAISDYYRAFHQRSKWLRDGNLQVDELEDYELRLQDEWSREFDAMKDGLDVDLSDNDLAVKGKDFYNKFELEKPSNQNLYIRPKVDKPFVMRGSMQILSNKFKIGWHPYFNERLLELYESTYKKNAIGS